jgi:hypothetical protein
VALSQLFSKWPRSAARRMVIMMSLSNLVSASDDQSGNESMRNKVFADKIIVDEISTITAG